MTDFVPPDFIPLAKLMKQTGWKRNALLRPLEAMNESGPLRGLVVIYVGKRKRPHINRAILQHIKDLDIVATLEHIDARLNVIELRLSRCEMQLSA